MRSWIRWLFLVWAGFAALTAVWGCVQFAGKIREAHALGLSFFSHGFYDFYVAERIKGFTSHWNTFSAEEMFALIMLAAFLLFGRAPRSWIWLKAVCAFLIALAVLLAETRGVWFATAAAGFYLLWVWKRKLLLLAPVVDRAGGGGFPARHPRALPVHRAAEEGGLQPVPHRGLAHRPAHD
jgi:putative inorganic carbon (hco3(-)) transporter